MRIASNNICRYEFALDMHRFFLVGSMTSSTLSLQRDVF